MADIKHTKAGLASARAWGRNDGRRSEMTAHKLGLAQAAMGMTEPFGTTVLYRVRLTDLSARAAGEACTRLMQRQLACMVVAPGHG